MPAKYVTYGKLVRHLVPNEIRENGDVPFVRELKSDAEFLREVRQKLYEERFELFQASISGDKTKIVSEAADLMEVVRTLFKVHHIPFRLLEKARLEKLRKKGGFKNRTFLIKVKENNSSE